MESCDGRVVVSDFGLATDSFESTASIHVGTVAYMAPEVLRGQRASFASDVWALGVVSHEIFFGQRPHWSPKATEMSSPLDGRTVVDLATGRTYTDVPVDTDPAGGVPA